MTQRAAASDDATLIALVDEWFAEHEKLTALLKDDTKCTDELVFGMMDKEAAIEKKIINTPAKSIAGMHCKLRWIECEQTFVDGEDIVLDAIRSLMADAEHIKAGGGSDE